MNASEIMHLNLSPATRIVALWLHNSNGKSGAISVYDIAAKLNLADTTVRRAMCDLKGAGLVRSFKGHRMGALSYELIFNSEVN